MRLRVTLWLKLKLLIPGFCLAEKRMGEKGKKRETMEEQ